MPGSGFWTSGWRVGGIVNARSGVPINVVIARPDNVTVGTATLTNIPGGNSRGTQRPDVVPGVDPYLKDGVRWLNPAAFTTPQPGTFGNLPRNALRGPAFWQADLMFSKDFRFLDTQGLQVRVEIFNIINRLNYENPAADPPQRNTRHAVHGRSDRDLRLHARSAESHRGSRNGSPERGSPSATCSRASSQPFRTWIFVQVLNQTRGDSTAQHASPITPEQYD